MTVNDRISYFLSNELNSYYSEKNEKKKFEISYICHIEIDYDETTGMEELCGQDGTGQG